MKNIKTTLAGLVAGLPLAVDALLSAYKLGTFDGKHGVQLALAIGLVLLGLASKDHNVTGGQVLQK